MIRADLEKKEIAGMNSYCAQGEIQTLDPDVVAQIAAGEVVERPASVVKELVENSLDAGAKRIDVFTQGGGKDLIRVVDDGCGMSFSDAQLCYRRHTTSKLKKTEDLYSLETMGFRGEGLYSIVAVSRLTLITRPKEISQGCCLKIEGGKLSNSEPAGCSPGSQFEVRDLFFNTPARQKFLKSSATEATHITELFVSLASAFNQVHFMLRQEDRTICDFPACANRLERAYALLGNRVGQLFVGSLADQRHHVEVCLSAPQKTARTARSLRLLVNRRPVRDRMLIQAVLAGYGDLLERGQYPLGIVHLDLSPDQIDVNVHPQKVEVRFAQPSYVFSVVKNCVAEVLASMPCEDRSSVARVYRLAGSAPSDADQKQRLEQATRLFWGQSKNVISSKSSLFAKEKGSTYLADIYRQNTQGYFSEEKKSQRVRLIGRAWNRVLVCEIQDKLALIDERAAWQLIAYEKLRHDWEQGAIEYFLLNEAVSILLDEDLIQIVKEVDETLKKLGIDLDHFGGKTWMIRSVPLPLKHADPKKILLTLLHHLQKNPQPDQALRLLATFVIPSDEQSPEEVLSALENMNLLTEDFLLSIGLVLQKSQIERETK